MVITCQRDTAIYFNNILNIIIYMKMEKWTVYTMLFHVTVWDNIKVMFTNSHVQQEWNSVIFIWRERQGNNKRDSFEQTFFLSNM